MNEKKAKALRKEVYGDFSLRDKRTYTSGSTIVNTGLRGIYRMKKRPKKNGLLWEVNS